MAHEAEIRAVEAAIEALKAESPTLAAKLASEQLAAATGLEYYGITKTEFERFLKVGSLSSAIASQLESGVEAMQRIFTS